MNNKIPQLKKQVRCIIIFFMAALIFSGATAIPAETELTILLQFVPPTSMVGSLLATVLEAVQNTQAHYPFLFYGNDWLAFAHFVIAVTFIGVIKDPVKNIWVLQFGMIACAMVLPFALVAGGLRGLPIWWRFIDCSFGIVGFIPLWICYKKTQQLEALINEDRFEYYFLKMKRSKNSIRKLAGDAAFIAAITLANRCMEKNEKPLVKRDMSGKELNRRLSMVNMLYHAIGIFITTERLETLF